MRAASAAADPPLDPPAVRSGAHGFATWSVVPPAANSWVWLWPARTAPWARRRRHTALSAAATLLSSTRLDAVRPRPPTAKRSLSAKGIPHVSGAASPSVARRASAARASSAANSGYRRVHALMAPGAPSKVGGPPLRAAIRAWQASSSSTADSAPDRSRAAASSRPRSAGSVATDSLIEAHRTARPPATRRNVRAWTIAPVRSPDRPASVSPASHPARRRPRSPSPTPGRSRRGRRRPRACRAPAP